MAVDLVSQGTSMLLQLSKLREKLRDEEGLSDSSRSDFLVHRMRMQVR